MSSLPPGHNAGKQNAASMLNRFAKRDPQLYPLFGIMLGIVGVAGYFLTQKAGKNSAEPAHHLLPPIGLGSASDPPQVAGSKVAEWKSHYRNARGSEGSDLE